MVIYIRILTYIIEMFAYFSKLNCVSLLLLNNYDSDDSNIEDDEYQFNNYTIARWAKEYNFMIMHPYNIVVREDIPPLFSYS